MELPSWVARLIKRKSWRALAENLLVHCQICQKMDAISQKLNNNPVYQGDFASGEVELF